MTELGASLPPSSPPLVLLATQPASQNRNNSLSLYEAHPIKRRHPNGSARKIVPHPFRSCNVHQPSVHTHPRTPARKSTKRAYTTITEIWPTRKTESATAQRFPLAPRSRLPPDNLTVATSGAPLPLPPVNQPFNRAVVAQSYNGSQYDLSQQGAVGPRIYQGCIVYCQVPTKYAGDPTGWRKCVQPLLTDSSAGYEWSCALGTNSSISGAVTNGSQPNSGGSSTNGAIQSSRLLFDSSAGRHVATWLAAGPTRLRIDNIALNDDMYIYQCHLLCTAADLDRQNEISIQ